MKSEGLVMIAGSVSDSQDGIVVKQGGCPHALLPDMATVRKCWSSQKPFNVAKGCVSYTINTRYDFAGIKDFTSTKHCKTCVIVIYER